MKYKCRIALLLLWSVGACSYEDRGAAGGTTAGTLSIVSGDGQRATVASALAEPLVVLATDADGEPIENLTVDFRILEGGGSLSDPSSRTDVLGRARSTLTLGTTIGRGTIEVEATGLDSEPVEFTATGVADKAVQLVPISVEQTGIVREPLADPMVVRAEDRFGNAVEGVSVQFAVVENSGSLSTAEVTSDARGEAATILTLGATAGPNIVEARLVEVPDSAITMTAHGTADTVASLTIASGNNQKATVGTMLPMPLEVVARDASGNPVPNKTVTFAPASANGSFSGDTTIATDAQGRARATFVLDTKAGINTATASATGVTSVTFSETGLAAAPAKLVAASNTTQTNIVAGTLAAPMVVLATDAFGNAVPGVAVSFTRTSGTGSLSASTVTTSAAGKAQTVLTTGTVVGPNGVTAQVANLPAVSFSVATVPGAVAQLVPTVSTVAVVASTLPLQVRALDIHGNPIPGLTVALRVDGGTLASSSPVTDASGAAQTSWTLPTVARVYTLSVSAGSLAAQDTGVSATADTPSQIVKFGDGQSTTCDGEVLSQPLVVRVTDRFDNPVAGTVTFTAEADTGALFPQNGQTSLSLPLDNQGQASATYQSSFVGQGQVRTDTITVRFNNSPTFFTTFTATVHGC
ncbi:MAG TPA: Ig-like domain-containing protein [Kofleriaceae bacterium]|nr:Ig-like domain-containing protein [Kofleriaceae bacterium]